MHPDEVHEERAALIKEITAAFHGVSRANGVSWSETDVLDDYGSMDERLRARASDTDRAWTELVDDPEWRPDSGWGGFSFLDAIGFRYYLPAAMLRSVREGENAGIKFHLTVPPRGDTLRQHGLEQLSLLNQRQARCVARFIRFMIEWRKLEGGGLDEEWWGEALASHWSDL